MSVRTLAILDAPISILRREGVAGLLVRGMERTAPRELVLVYFSGVHTEALPDHSPRTLTILERTDESGQCSWQLEADGETRVLNARSVQVHRSAAQAFLRAVPAMRPSWGARVGWMVLLQALRIPGFAGLLAWARARA